MKFKVGDKVRVREDLEADKRYGRQVFVDGMKRYRGKVMEVNSDSYGEYYLKEDQFHWSFTDEMLEPVDLLADKIEERNNKPTDIVAQGVPYTIDEFFEEQEQEEKENAIKPAHYRKGEIDLFESWYRTRPFNEFRAGMQMIAERYMKRDKNDRIQDLNKAVETIKRLKEYEEKEESQDNDQN